MQHFHNTMSTALIHIAQMFIRWSNWHYKRAHVVQPVCMDFMPNMPTVFASMEKAAYEMRGGKMN